MYQKFPFHISSSCCHDGTDEYNKHILKVIFILARHLNLNLYLSAENAPINLLLNMNWGYTHERIGEISATSDMQMIPPL